MSDVWSVVRWWDDWQLRILVLGSLFLQWFLLLAAPMRKYTVPRILRTCIWVAYISSDALAIYALATLFNRHARACDGIGGTGSKQHSSSILEVLWAPILLIHLGGQEEMAGYEIEDNELWTRHTVTLVSQVAVALYAFCKSWPASSDWKLLAAAVLLFVIGVVSFSEKPLALNRAKIKRLASISALIQGTKKRSKWRERLHRFFLFEESNCFTELPASSPAGRDNEEPNCFTELRRSLSSCWNSKEAGSDDRRRPSRPLTEGDKVLMVLSDMSLSAAARDLVDRKKAAHEEDVLPPLTIAEKALPRWLRTAFAFIYTRAVVVVTPLYLYYHLLVVPVFHVAALALFTTCDKHPYRRADVKITYIVLCLTAALDFFAVFIRKLLYQLLSNIVPALCETVPGYDIIDAALLESRKGIIGFIYKCARQVGFNCKEYFACKPQLGKLYKKVSTTVIADLVDARGRDLGSYRIFLPESSSNWAISKDLQAKCGVEIKKSLDRVSFDRSVLLWHIATNLCSRCEVVEEEGGEQQEEEGGEQQEEVKEPEEEGLVVEEEGEQPEEVKEQEEEGLQGGGGGEQPEEVKEPEEEGLQGGGGGGEQQEEMEVIRAGEQQEEVEIIREGAEDISITSKRAHLLYRDCTKAISNYMAHLFNFKAEMLLTGSREHLISEAMDEIKSFFLSSKAKFQQQDELKKLISDIADNKVPKPDIPVFHIIEACKLAKELLEIPESTRWMLMYRVWLGMLCYSASMCRGYLHAKSLGEGGEFLSFVWLVLSLKGAKTLADKLQMPPEPGAEGGPAGQGSNPAPHQAS